MLDKLIPAAQRLIALNRRTLGMWLWQISDHERALLVTWAVHYGSEWITASLDAAMTGPEHMNLKEPQSR